MINTLQLQIIKELFKSLIKTLNSIDLSKVIFNHINSLTPIDDFKYQAQRLAFDYYGEYLLVQYNPNTIRILKTGTWTPCYSISFEEEIVKAAFSPIKRDLFILTSKSQLKKCRLQENSITMEREYWTLHNGLITDFQISKNAAYIFTVGEDNLLKVWDYFMRGKLMPTFQAFTTGGKIRDVVLSNDNFNFIFSYGVENNGIFCWQFYSDLVSRILEEEDDIQEQTELPVREEKPLLNREEDNPFVEREFVYTETLKSSKVRPPPPERENVQSIYQTYEDIVGERSSTINLNSDTVTAAMDKRNRSPNLEETHGKYLPPPSNFSTQVVDAVSSEVSGLADTVSQEVLRKKKVTFNELERYEFNEENLGNLHKGYDDDDDLELRESQHNTPDTYKLPGHHLSMESIIGANVSQRNPSVIWNHRDNYFAHAFSSSIIVTYLEEPKTQKYLSGHHSDEISFLDISTNKKYLVSASALARNEASCNVSVWDASKMLFLRTLTHNKLHRISSIDISPCENYILVLGHSSYEDHALLFIWELQSGLIVSNTLYAVPRAHSAKWNNKIKGSLEFALITEESITFWRLNHLRNLEYQEAVYDRLVLKGQKFLSVSFLECKLFKDTSFMFVGTSQGSLMIFDTRSNTLLFTCNRFLKGPINLIFAHLQRLILCTEDAGVYSWKLDLVSEASDLAKLLEENPDILLMDSKPYCGYFLTEKDGIEVNFSCFSN